MEESSLLNFPWRYEISKCVSNFIKKTPMKEVLASIINGVIAHVFYVELLAVCRERWKPGFHFERARSGLFDNGDDFTKVRKGLSL